MHNIETGNTVTINKNASRLHKEQLNKKIGNVIEVVENKEGQTQAKVDWGVAGIKWMSVDELAYRTR